MVLSGDLSGAAGGAVGRLLTVEEVAVGELQVVDPLQTPHEIQVPVGPPELAVGDHVVAGGLLLSDKLPDQPILHAAQFIPGDVFLPALLSCGLQVLRAQKAPDIVIAKRCVQAHGILSFRGGSRPAAA